MPLWFQLPGCPDKKPYQVFLSVTNQFCLVLANTLNRSVVIIQKYFLLFFFFFDIKMRGGKVCFEVAWIENLFNFLQFKEYKDWSGENAHFNLKCLALRYLEESGNEKLSFTEKKIKSSVDSPLHSISPWYTSVHWRHGLNSYFCLHGFEPTGPTRVFQILCYRI